MFEMNWVEYVRRDTEGSDSDTRRRAASELVKALTDRFPQQVGGLGGGGGGGGGGGCAKHCVGHWAWHRPRARLPCKHCTMGRAHSSRACIRLSGHLLCPNLLPPPSPSLEQVTELFSGYVGAMLAEHAHAPAANWKAKDCALYLVTALTVRGKTAAAGATTTNTLVNLQACGWGEGGGGRHGKEGARGWLHRRFVGQQHSNQFCTQAAACPSPAVHPRPLRAVLQLLNPFPCHPALLCVLQDFFVQQVAPELQAANPNEQPVLKVGVLGSKARSASRESTAAGPGQSWPVKAGPAPLSAHLFAL